MAVKTILAALLFLLFPVKVYAAFSIESIDPTEITSDSQEIKLFVSATNLSSSTQYLQAAITKEGKSNFFGFTQNNSGNWIQYQSSPDLNSLLAFTPVDGNWNGEVQAKIDKSDSGFAGPGIYSVKLLKYITSSGSSSNSVPITISIPSASVIPSVVEGSRSESPTIQFSTPDNLKVGEEFEISFTVSNFDPGNFYVKTRMGVDSSHLTLGQTYNSEWLSDTDSWSKFPQVSGSSKIKARLSPTASAGNHVLKVRLKKTDSDKIYDSEEKSVNFKENPSPPSSSPQTTSKATPTKTPTLISKTTGAVLAAATKSSTVEAEINEALKNKDLLATTSALNPSVKNPKKPLDLLVKKKGDGFLIPIVISLFGGVLVLGSGAYFLRKKFMI